MPVMLEPEVLRALALWLPFLGAASLVFQRRDDPKILLVAVVNFCWLVSTLFVVKEIAVYTKLWSFDVAGGSLFNTPVDLLIGWASLWLIPTLFPKWPLVLVVAVALALDLLAMPWFESILILHDKWLLGEVMAIGLSLIPSLFASRWMHQSSHLNWRVIFYAATYALTFLVLMPSAVLFATGDDWRDFWDESFVRVFLRSLFLLTLLPGISSTIEFLVRGSGTPIPLDPPKKLVTSGLYAYVRNPMQISCFLSYLVLGCILDNYWVCVGALSVLSWSLSITFLQEQDDMEQRFGESWAAYRSCVMSWIPKWRPASGIIGGDGRMPILYVSEDCEACQSIRQWLLARQPVDLKIVAAESHPTRDLLRITYSYDDHHAEEEGVAALMRAFEHIDLRYALLSAFVRTPGLLQIIQLTVDAFGGGPQLVRRRDR